MLGGTKLALPKSSPPVPVSPTRVPPVPYRLFAASAAVAFAVPVSPLTPSTAAAQRPTVAPPSVARAATLVGRVTDPAGAPIAGARVQLVELFRTTATDAEGRYRFSAVAPGTYTVSVSRIGRAPEARRLTLAAGPRALDVTLRAALVELSPVQVTAGTAASRVQDSPQPVAVLEGAALRTAQGAALGDALEQVPGVRSLSMTTGIGKPVIRGMTHYRVVTLDNGQRSETQAWGHDHSPNVETAAAERVEVIKGPASVLYGSDALGGVVNVVAPAVPDALDGTPFVRGRVTTAYNHNVRGRDGVLALEGARGGWGLRGALIARASEDMRTPVGVLRNTTNRATGGELAAGRRGAWGSATVRYTGRDERIEIYDDPAESPGYTGFQRIATHRAAAEATLPVGRGGARLQVNGGYEQNFRREFADAGATAPDLGLFVRTWTGFAHLHHRPVGPFAGTLGASAMASDFANRGTELLIPDSRTRTAAVYAFEEAELGRWRLTGGARYDWRTLATPGEAALALGADRRRFGAATGSLGALYRLRGPVALVANVARGFRAPAAPDLYANGFHEGTRAFERGDPGLRVETSLNTEAGVRVNARTLTAEATAFVNRVDDYIYLRPFGAGGGVFDSLQVVQGDARLVGWEARAAWRPVRWATWQLAGDYVRGQNTSAAVPLTFVPPLRVQGGVRLERGRALGLLGAPYLSVQGEAHARQTRLDPRDLGPAGYALLHLGGGFTAPTARGALLVDLSVRNALDAEYRSFLSRYKAFAFAPGRAVVLRVTAPL